MPVHDVKKKQTSRWLEKPMMRIVEHISPMLACNNEQAMKNQYMAWADSLNNAATRDLQRTGCQGWC